MATLFSQWFKKNEKERLEKQGDVKDATTSEMTAVPTKTEKKKKKVSKEIVLKGVLLKNLMTEKISLYATSHVYGFEVKMQATKRDVAAAIKSTFNVIPKKVNIVRSEGKVVRFGRTSGKRSDTKKAYVFLKEGDSIVTGAESEKTA